MSQGRKKTAPARSPEAQEQQLISLAMAQAEQQLRDGTAPPSIVTHFLKLATTHEELEKEKLRQETELLKAKKKNLESTERMEELYTEAMRALSDYKGEYIEREENQDG